jgi:ABC-type antimicrobial peptide transport system permease subunit
MDKFIECIRIAILSMCTNRLRTGLSMLGVIIGVSSVIIIGTVGKVGKMLVLEELETFGLKSIWVYREEEEEIGRIEKQGTGITNSDIEAIKRECNLVELVSPCIRKRGIWARNNNNILKVDVEGVSSSHHKINNDALSTGRFLTLMDVEYRRNVCVIGDDVYRKLFDTTDEPVNSQIYIGDRRYTVVGVLKRKNRDFMGHFGFPDANRMIFIPYTIIQHQENTEDVDYIQASAYSKDTATPAAEQIARVLKRRHAGRNYITETMHQHIEFANSIINILIWIGLSAVSVSLIVGGIGIMNVMIASVAERTREIGIRKAVGASDVDILIQFLIESVTISLSGSIAGIVLGTAITFTIEYLTGYPFIISFGYMVLAVFMSVVVGIIFGIYPAVSASRLEPAEALRYE